MMNPSPYSRSFRSKTSRSVLRSLLPHAVSLAICLALAVVTAVYYVAIRSHNVELSFDQLSAFERQVTNIGNRSVYVVEPPRKDEVMTSLSTKDWAKVSSHIDLVAFIYDEPFTIVNYDWLSKVERAFGKMSLGGYGIVLFSCGCVIPNKVFVNTETRFNGAECTMLPGFVIPNEDVSFIEVQLIGSQCKNRNAILSSNWYERNAGKLEEARKEHAALRDRISLQNV